MFAKEEVPHGARCITGTLILFFVHHLSETQMREGAYKNMSCLMSPFFRRASSKIPVMLTTFARLILVFSCYLLPTVRVHAAHPRSRNRNHNRRRLHENDGVEGGAGVTM